MNPTSETTQQRSVSVFTAIAALTLVSAVLLGAWDTIGALKNPDTYQVPSTFQDFREGKTTGTFEKQLDKNMPSRAEIIATANSIRYTILGGTGDQVRNGKDGWLYLTEELGYEAAASANLRARADLLGNASKALEAIGVKLVVALIPDKARVAAYHLQSGKYPDYNQERYRDALSELHKRNVTAVDLLLAITEASRVTDTYYRTDTHWNQTGAQIAAKAIANVIQPLRIELGQTAFTSVASKDAISRPGDLIRLMGLEHTPDWLRPTPDVEATIVTTQQSNAVAGGGLFGEAEVAVVLVGTSYSLRGNFHGFLQQELGTKVLNTAKDGGGFLQATTDYLTNDAFRTSKPKVLIWEIPERFVTMALKDEGNWLQKVGLSK